MKYATSLATIALGTALIIGGCNASKGVKGGAIGAGAGNMRPFDHHIADGALIHFLKEAGKGDFRLGARSRTAPEYVKQRQQQQYDDCPKSEVFTETSHEKAFFLEGLHRGASPLSGTWYRHSS